MLCTDFFPWYSLMMKSGYLSVCAVSAVRLNICGLSLLAPKTIYEAQKIIQGVSALFRKPEYWVATYTTKQALLCGVGL